MCGRVWRSLLAVFVIRVALLLAGIFGVLTSWASSPESVNVGGDRPATFKR